MKLDNLKTFSNDSGSFTELFKLPHDGQVSCLLINPGETRGNHYHIRKTETFVVLYGSAIIKVRNRKTGDLMKVEVGGGRQIAAKVSPQHTHSITATSEGAIIAIWCDEQFNESDADTYPEEI